MRKLIALYFLLAIFLSSYVTAEEMTREKASSIMAECNSLRESKIAPLKEQAIADCVLNKSGSTEYCKRRNENYGENRRVDGVNRPGMFWGLPVCEEAISAERYYKKYPSRK